ncbi:hypothetical protein ACFWBC_04885 [Streptomyces sp. NPDC059985]|uniref:hypothetical protein n=1 Tax=Streptomyces sp. NPDC059985 TaxID=3347025 RepID=UPI0036CC7B5E
MTDSGKAVVGRRPLGFTDAKGSQRSVPLSAFTLAPAGDLTLKASWKDAFPTEADRSTLARLAEGALATGDIAAAPEPARQPAVIFKAVAPGPRGNTIEVELTHSAEESAAELPKKKTLLLMVTRTDTYKGLRGPGDAVRAIGTGGSPEDDVECPLGTGLIQVKCGTAAAVDENCLPKPFDGVVKSGQGAKVQADADNCDQVVTSGRKAGARATRGNCDYFTLVLNEGLPEAVSAEGVRVQITVDVAARTYDLTASFTSDRVACGTSTVPTFTGIAGTKAALVTVTAPAQGFAPPMVPQTLKLGGGDGVAATGVAYTS